MKLLRIVTVLLVFLSGTPSTFAQGNTLTVSSPSGQPGQTVSVTVSITNGSTCAGGSIAIKYDASKLEVVSAQKGSALSEGTVNINTEYSNNSIKLNWMGSTPISGGSLCTVTFKIKSTASGTASVTLMESKLSDAYGNPIVFQIVNGSVNITGSVPPTTQPTMPPPIGGGGGNGGGGIVITPTPTPTPTITPTPTQTPDAKIQPVDIGEVSWAQEYIRDVIDRGIMKGYAEADGSTSFKPNGTATRAEFATALFNYLGFEKDGTATFADTQEHWAKEYASKLVKEGIMAGYGQDRFAPDEPVTREQIATILNRALHPQNTPLVFEYTDHGMISDWASESVYAVRWAGWMSGDDSGTFRPDNTATRAEIATIFSRLAKNNIGH